MKQIIEFFGSAKRSQSLQTRLDAVTEASQTLQTRFELVNQASSDGLWDMSVIAGDPVNPKNEFWWSDQFRKLLGYNDETDFPNVLDSWASRLHPDDQDWVLKAFAAHLTDYTGRTPYDVEYQLLTKHQGYRWFRARGTTMRDSGGVPLRVAGSLADITTEKHRLLATQTLQTRFELVNQASSDGLWDMSVIAGDPVNPKNEFWWSDQFRKLLGYNDETDFPNVLDSWASRLHPDDQDWVLKAFAAHLTDYTGRTPYDVEYQLLTKHQGYRWFLARGTTMRDSGGVPLRVAGSLADITDEKRHLLAMQVLQTRFELVNRASSDGLWDMSVIAGDPVNPKNEFWWSDQFRKLLGYNDETDFPNVLDSWASKLHPDDQDWVLKAFAAHLTDYSGQTPYDVEYQLLTKHQEYRWFRARGTTMRDAVGVPLRVAGSLSDITTEKQRIIKAQDLAGTAAAASSEYAASAEGMAEGARHQTEQTTQNAAALEEMVASLTQTCQNATLAARTAGEAGATAEQGGQVVGKTIAGMNKIADIVDGAAGKVMALGDSSKRVGKIVGVIDSIAEQTNLLALNAAIEAARAGAEGRGFAVVADEVRKLAEHTAVSTKEIAQVIEQIQKDTAEALGVIQSGKQEVERGRELTGQAEQALAQIIHASKQVDAIIAEVAASVQQQLGTSELLAQSTEVIDDIAKANALSIEEMVRGSVNIEQIVQDLVDSLTGETTDAQTRRKSASHDVPPLRNPLKLVA